MNINIQEKNIKSLLKVADFSIANVHINYRRSTRSRLLNQIKMESEHIMAVLDEGLIPVIGKKRYFSLQARMELQEMLDHNNTVKSSGEGKKITQEQMLERINATRKENDQMPYTMYWLKKVKKEL